MTAGRKTTKTPKIIAAEEIIDAPHFANAMVVMQEEGQADQAVMLFEEVFRQVGQIESFEFTRRVADVAIAQVFENLRESGKYKGLPYKDAAGNTRRVADIEEFCDAKLGKSYRRCLDLSQNFRVLGKELYEHSERLGLRAVDYKALRALPEDDQVIIKKALGETASRDDVLEVLQQLAAKNGAEKQEAAKRIKDLEGEIKAKEDVLATRAKQVDTLEEKLARVKTLPPDEVQAEILAEATTHLNKALGVTTGKLRQALLALVELDQREAGIKDFRPMAAGLVGQLQQAITTLRDELLLTDIVADGMPEWMRATAHLEGQD